MGNIVKMSAHLANMIAAGEVVERPTSVVKELVENAIDAKASSVKVILKNGGIDEIKIIDDGVGMDSDDVLMSFVPHATSKIKTEYDLFRINTLGFRGEAVASIAAVSNMQIISSQNGTDGYQVTYRFGSLESSGVTHSNKGTTVIVSDLFYNTPARLKYLKPAKTELASISYLLDRIAISHPNIRISLINDGKELLHTSASSSSSRLMGEVYGIEVAKKLNADVNCVFKTLVTIAPNKNHYVFILPANKELDLKLCAKAVNEKSIEMIPMKTLLPTTGYVRGGCSPFAMKKVFPTIIDQSIEEVDKVYVSGGKLGLQLHIASNDLIHATNALVTKITRD